MVPSIALHIIDTQQIQNIDDKLEPSCLGKQKFCHLLALWPWATHTISPSLNFLISKIEIVLCSLQNCCNDYIITIIKINSKAQCPMHSRWSVYGSWVFWVFFLDWGHCILFCHWVWLLESLILHFSVFLNSNSTTSVDRRNKWILWFKWPLLKK